MKEVIRIDVPTVTPDKPVEFTHYLNGNDGWERLEIEPSGFAKVVYLGKCSVDGDMFAAYSNSAIDIYKGHLNSGRY